MHAIVTNCSLALPVSQTEALKNIKEVDSFKRTLFNNMFLYHIIEDNSSLTKLL